PKFKGLKFTSAKNSDRFHTSGHAVGTNLKGVLMGLDAPLDSSSSAAPDPPLQAWTLNDALTNFALDSLVSSDTGIIKRVVGVFALATTMLKVHVEEPRCGIWLLAGGSHLQVVTEIP